MQANLCRGCRRQLLNENNEKNIFHDDVLIKSCDPDGTYNKKWNMKLHTAIELITSQKATKEEKISEKLCEICFKNVETFVNFRFQLLKSRDILLSSCKDDKDTIADSSKTMNVENLLMNTSIPIINGNTATDDQLVKVNLFKSEFCSSPVASKSVGSFSTPKITSSDDLINVDDSSTSFDVHSLQNEDVETNDSLTCRLQNDQENNNLNESDNSVDDAVVVSTVDEVYIKPHEHDIESEIDVCSGEEDDVLELDVQKLKNETVEINSSSESDIEVCDYEPTGKRGHYNALTPPIRF